MNITVNSAIVYRNIKLFKQIIAVHRAENLTSFSAYVNCKTGEVVFNTERGAPPKGAQEWKSICLHLRTPRKDQPGGFEILEEETNEILFQCDELAPMARKILGQMVAALNQILAHSPRPEVAEDVLEEVVMSEMETSLPMRAEKDPVHAAWHNVDRVAAEDLLDHLAVGSYLFRKDSFAALLEEQLSSRFRTPITCITLTYLQPHQKVTDMTLVNKDKHWYIYDDDPSLEETAYSDISSLLASCKAKLGDPILFEKTL